MQHPEVLTVIGNNDSALLHRSEEYLRVSRAVTLLAYRGYGCVSMCDQFPANSLLRIVIQEEIWHRQLRRDTVRVDPRVDGRFVPVVVGDCGSHGIFGNTIICRSLPNDRIVNEALKVAGMILGSSLGPH